MVAILIENSPAVIDGLNRNIKNTSAETRLPRKKKKKEIGSFADPFNKSIGNSH